MIIRIQHQDFDTAALQRELTAGRSDVGAIASFIGLVRDLEGDALQQMTLEHYPGMTEKALEGISKRAAERWQV
ncbi:MAG: molybdenum cofactor biosynthesis protein MoaE, partial [Gammaproteobacteria bacterium]|nr:molybdenum cofactor biosynthesis protein MoaE [Gammaproteobacteria bacterium]